MVATIPPQAIAIVRQYEGCKLTSYRDGKGVLTIGCGHTGPDVTIGLTWTMLEAEEALANDLQRALEIVTSTVKIPLNDNQLSALISFAFNVGRGDFTRSGMLKVLNRYDYKGAMDHLLLWNHVGSYVSPGLTARRQAEKALFLTPLTTVAGI
jgi:lysozyme